MTTPSLPRLSRFALAGLAGLAACAGETTAPTAMKAPTSARLALGPTTNSAPETGKIKVCKTGNVSGTFTASRVQFVAPGFDAPVTPSGTVDPSETVAAGSCTVIAEDNGGNGIASDVTVTETNAANLKGIVVTGTDATPSGYNANGGTLRVNSFHGWTITFNNVAEEPPPPPPSSGCTYTQGWYKNHTSQWPAGFSPNASFDGGMSWIDLYKTPPKKGNEYIQLAHQYMTAVMNASGASVPADVQTALNKAAAYFAAGGNGAGSGNIAGVAAILDAYNNGVTGPGHCD